MASSTLILSFFQATSNSIHASSGSWSSYREGPSSPTACYSGHVSASAWVPSMKCPRGHVCARHGSRGAPGNTARRAGRQGQPPVHAAPYCVRLDFDDRSTPRDDSQSFRGCRVDRVSLSDQSRAGTLCLSFLSLSLFGKVQPTRTSSTTLFARLSLPSPPLCSRIHCVRREGP